MAATASAGALRLQVDLSENELRALVGEEEIARYPVSVGKDSNPTPEGTFKINKLIWNPSWVPPNEKWAKGKAEIEYGSHIPTQKFETIPGFDIAPVAYTSDIPLLTKWGKPLLFGPGSIHVAHTADEFIAVDELRASVDAYERIVRTLLKS